LPWTDDRLKQWLAPQHSGESPYRHLWLREQADGRGDGLKALAEMVGAAHQDAINWLRSISTDALDPLQGSEDEAAAGENDHPPPGSNYPHGLHTTTLQGYLGEVLAGLIAENYRPFDLDWEVPVFLFRRHDAAFNELERQRFLGSAAARRVPGKFGNDCLAFMKEDGEISAFLTCEAKCTASHDASLIAEGHKQLSSNNAHIPIDLYQLLDILRSQGDHDAEAWVEQLSPLLTLSASDAPRHYDLFVYVCGRGRKNGKPWMSTSSAHDKYEAERDLEAAEVRFEDIDAVIVTAYPGHSVNRGNG
jgi:hypothetical protein